MARFLPSRAERKTMKHSFKKLAATIAVAGLTMLGVNAVSPASALPYQGAHITLVTPWLTDANTSQAAKNQAMADGWVLNKWFGDGLKYQRTFAPVGSRIILTYHVTQSDGVTPLVGENVILRMNKQYSDSRAQISVDGVMAKAATSAADGGKVTHVTDQYGNVSFVVLNLDSDGEQQPSSFTGAPVISADGLDDTHAQFLPSVGGEVPDHSVITEFHYYVPNDTPVAAPVTHPTIRMASPALIDANSIHRTDLETLFSVTNTWYHTGIGVRQVYATIGTTSPIVYHVTDDNGAPAADTVVKLHVGKAYSGSNAKVADATNGTPNAPVNLSAANDADQALWTSTTDAFGNVLFLLKNSDTVGEPIPATKTTATPVDKAHGAVFTQIWPDVAGAANDTADMVEFHYISLPVVAPSLKTGASVSGTAKVGSTLTASRGSGTGTNLTFAYKWYRCVGTVAASKAAPAAAAKCVAIAKATALTYKLVAADKGKYVTFQLTASNSAGTAISLAKSTAKVG